VSNLSTALSFAPVYAPLPAYLSRSAVAISPRFPRDGTVTGKGGQTIGTDGVTNTITPERSVVEAQAWGATVALWSYTDQAASLGFASPEQFVGEFVAAGIPIQGTTNTRAVNPSTGPFMKDAGGSDWSAGSAPTRPLVGGLPQTPSASRISVSIDYMPAADVTNTQTPKLATIASQVSTGCIGIHMDDPRAGAAYSHWPGITTAYDNVGQGCDFSATAIAGFAVWLAANTTSAQRTALGLPSDPTGFDLLAHLKANYSTVMFTPGQDNGTLVDNYRFRTTLQNNGTLRAIMTWHSRFLRDDHASYCQAIRTQLAGKPFSFNAFNFSPMELLSWIGRRSLFDLAVAETSPPYWVDLSSHTVGSAAFLAARESQCARQHMNAVMCDYVGLRAFFEHKPTAPNTAPARVVTQLLRQSIMQSVMEGASPIVPIDVFLTTNDEKSQGTAIDGYRWWGNRANFKDCFDFIKANASLIDGYEKCAAVFVAVHADSWPFYAGAQGPRFYALMGRLAELWRRDVDYHFLIVGSSEGLLPTDPSRTVETTAPLILRVQDDSEYYGHLGRLAGARCRPWDAKAADEAVGHSPVRSTNPNVRATCRYNATTGRYAVHLHNYAVNVDGTPAAQTTTLVFNWGTPGTATVTRLGESSTTASFTRGAASVTLTEYAIVSF
jgi:hypothetical protein